MSNVCLHNHTQNSIKDSVVTVDSLVKKAKELDFKTLALTDHGTLTGCYGFYTACNKVGIKPILGCELYVKDYSFGNRLHLIVMAKDWTGYQAIIKAVKLSNKLQEKVSTLIFPITNAEILKTCFGEGSTGHEHVVATSACINGVIAGIPAQNRMLGEIYTKNEELIKKEADKTFLAAQYQKKIAEAEDILKKDKTSEYGKKLKTEAKKALNSLNKSADNADAAKAQNDIIGALYKGTDKELRDFMESEALRYEEIFGKGNFFMELQYHYMPEEKKEMFICDLIAQKYDIPTCAANDAHMLDSSDESIYARQTITATRFNRLEPVSKSESECYLKTDTELKAMISEVVGPARADVAMQGNDRIDELCNIVLPEKENHYPVFKKGEDSLKILKQKIKEGIDRRFNGVLPDGYAERIQYELDIMIQLKVVDYILIVQDLLNFGRKLGNMPVDRFEYLSEHIWEMSYDEIVSYVDADQSYFGYPVGPGRGSSGGSEICYLIGIIDIDPIPYNLLFERFLNPERVSMPDIDSDYANGYRDLVVIYTYKKYGKDAVCRIVTFGTNAAKQAIRTSARVLGKTKSSRSGDETIEKKYLDLGDSLSKVCSGKPHDVLSNYDETWAGLNEESKEIINRAKSIEGSYSQYNMHACGVIISDNSDVSEYIPLMFDPEKNVWKSQLTPAEAEDFGLLKMDYLGLRNLNMITEMIRLIYDRHDIKINPSVIPVEKDCIKQICQSGNTNSIFQLESSGMKKICKEMQPSSFEDLILLVAAYRPGPMDSIPEIIAVKNKTAAPNYLVPELEHILNVTYTKPIYQEQIQQIFRDLAGYSFGQADNVRRAMAKKKEKVLLAEREAFVNGDVSRHIDGCVSRGISAEKANKLFDEMVDFAKYAFNKSHAAVYARIAYIMMYLKHHYFVEFMVVALKWATKQSKLLALINDCHKNGYNILVPDINRSGYEYIIDGNNIIYNLTAIKGINDISGIIDARKEKLFDSLKDFVLRTNTKRNVTEALISAGAFDKLISSRKGALLMLEQLLDIKKSYNDIKAKIESTREIIRLLNGFKGSEQELLAQIQKAGYTGKKIPKIDRKIKDLEKFEQNLKAVEEEFSIIEEPLTIKDDPEELLIKEKELLGVYLSGHPTDSYEAEKGTSNIEDISEDGRARISGVITEVNVKKTKKSNKDMAFITLEDKTGNIDVVVFPTTYERYKDFLKENAVVNILCDIEKKTEVTGTDENGDPIEEEVFSAILKDISPAQKKGTTLLMSVNLITDWADLYDQVAFYESKEPEASKLLLYIKSENAIRLCSFRVRNSILMDAGFKIKSI